MSAQTDIFQCKINDLLRGRLDAGMKNQQALRPSAAQKSLGFWRETVLLTQERYLGTLADSNGPLLHSVLV